MSDQTNHRSYPDHTDFIFTIFDDTDVSTFDYIKPIYDRLIELGYKTTKTVWPLAYSGKSHYTGSHTLEDSPYLEYVRYLKTIGFEIAFHGATMETSTRQEVKASIEKFNKLLSVYPRSYAAHSCNRDNLYWGKDRFSLSLFKFLYNLLSSTSSSHFQGHVENSPYFWGDLAKKYICYMRNFTFDEINLLTKKCPLPYRNHYKHWANYWFYSCDADNVESFNFLLKEENQDKLIREKGVCIISTHFGKGFAVDGKLHPETDRLLKRLSQANGWFMPVCQVLDHLRSTQPTDKISFFQLVRLELEWFIDAAIRRKKNLPYEKTEVPFLRSGY
jgi:hypothetical protein